MARRSYTRDEKYEAAVYYMLYGNMQEVSDNLGIPYPTMVGWVKRDPVFQEMYELAVENAKKKFDAKTSYLIDQSLEVIERKLKQEMADLKAGNSKLPLSHLSSTMAVLFDKRQLMRNAPTSITEKKSVDHLKELADTFKDIAEGKVQDYEEQEIH